jgi:methylated-DNA-[protein]-cysteine S-methyltransferase
MTPTWTRYESPLGPLTLIAGPHGLAALRFPGQPVPTVDQRREPAAFAAVTGQLDGYFAGTRTEFDLELEIAGTVFQKQVWARLRTIPYGETLSYGALANAIGRPDRVRAVAAAVGRTPIPIIIPCHRVIGANGDLTGYGGGLDRKQVLLALEAETSGHALPAAVWRDRQLALV